MVRRAVSGLAMSSKNRRFGRKHYEKVHRLIFTEELIKVASSGHLQCSHRFEVVSECVDEGTVPKYHGTIDDTSNGR